MDETTTTLFDKKSADLTVKDQLKMLAVVSAVVIAVPIAISLAGASIQGVREYRFNRRIKKDVAELEALKQEINEELKED